MLISLDYNSWGRTKVPGKGDEKEESDEKECGDDGYQKVQP